MQTYIVYDPELCEFVREQGSFKLTLAKPLLNKELRNKLLMRATSASSDSYSYSFYFDVLSQEEEEQLTHLARSLIMQNKE